MAKEKAGKPAKGDKAAAAPKKPAGKKEKKGAAEAKLPTEPPRLKVRYESDVRKAVAEQFGIANPHAQPQIEKVVLNMGIGLGHENKKLLETLIGHLGVIAGQQPVATKARRSVAGFKIRENYIIGTKVTLRKHRMWYFLDKLISLAVPRVRDFRGLNPESFDKAGNYSMGLAEQGLFPEVNVDKIDHNEVHGMDITIVFSNSTPDKSRFVLSELGMPFKRNEEMAHG